MFSREMHSSLLHLAWVMSGFFLCLVKASGLVRSTKLGDWVRPDAKKNGVASSGASRSALLAQPSLPAALE
jgi:hypothetical protein